MKKLIVALLLIPLVAGAQWRHPYHHYHGPRVVYQQEWVAPLIIGGVLGAVISNQNHPQPQVVVEQPPVIVQRPMTCTEWREIETPDGRRYRERTCQQ